MGFSENLKKIPPVGHVDKIELLHPDGRIEATIENKPGQSGSLAVYHYLASKYGMIHCDAAREGLELFAEHTGDAQTHPGKHPNIDRLFRIHDENLRFIVRMSNKSRNKT